MKGDAIVGCGRRDFLRSVGLGTISLLVGSCAGLGKGPGRSRPGKKPNIVFILADDLGWAELGCYGNGFNETPNLDRLAAKAMRFTQAYASAPVCSPYRASLVTGQYPARIGMTNYLQPDDADYLSTDHVTIAEMLKSAGYVTGIIGKWHLTGYAKYAVKEVMPDMHGFDETIVSENDNIADGYYFYPYKFNTGITKRLPGREYLTDRQNLEAVEFIDRHRNGPFFLYLSHYAVHTTLDAKEELVAKYLKKPRAGKDRWAVRNNPHLAAQLESIDEGVGMIINKLDELGLADNTIVIFTSDNGGEERVTTNGPLREGKTKLYEGGTRVPLIMHAPGVTPAGSVCTVPVCVTDFYPTFRELASLDTVTAQHMDGISLMPLLNNPGAHVARDALYWHYPLPKTHWLGGRSCGAVRKGNWKLLEFFDDGHLELYNLEQDIAETNNLAEKMPQKTAELLDLLRSWRKHVGAQEMTVNPIFKM